MSNRRRVRVRVEGVVQGVGFRPHVFRLAQQLQLDGWVRNSASDVELEAEGETAAIDLLLQRLSADAPPLAVIDTLRHVDVPAQHCSGFEILASTDDNSESNHIAPDAATCEDCLRELRDPANRRYRYPFTNCTNCGPRFSIVMAVPYDRASTSMAAFAMCPTCQHEYDDPGNRRFHAQPNACAECGPTLQLLRADGSGSLRGDHALRVALQMLAAGSIVAIKGLGGFHLSCLASSDAAVSELRTRKRRDAKPFAIMVRDIRMARTLVDLDESEIEQLASPFAPIVLARAVRNRGDASSVAPGMAELGIMLPYTPLHHLLLEEIGQPLVMTSGNVADEPIVWQDAQALERFGTIADALLTHDRPIVTRTDDSVVRVVSVAGIPAAQCIRRSRGSVPAAIALPFPSLPLLACGAELKNTFAIAHGRAAWVSHHVGDLKSWATLESYRDGIAHWQRLLGVRPELIVHDQHPDYISTHYALEQDVPVVSVQHHHAHFAATLAEHGERGLAIGVIYDGAGHGDDGTTWGGEFLHGSIANSRRVASLWPVPLPGGDYAARDPWRMACAWMVAAGLDPEGCALQSRVDRKLWHGVRQLASSATTPRTSSAGRLCDAVAALAGGSTHSRFEGEAAMLFEAAIDHNEHDAYPLPWTDGDDRQLLDPRELIHGVVRDAGRGASLPVISARFHNALVTGSRRLATMLAEQHDTNLVVLSGGVFQNRYLLERLGNELHQAGFKVLAPRKLPPNDGGISYGQAATAAARHALNGGG